MHDSLIIINVFVPPQILQPKRTLQCREKAKLSDIYIHFYDIFSCFMFLLVFWFVFAPHEFVGHKK